MSVPTPKKVSAVLLCSQIPEVIFSSLLSLKIHYAANFPLFQFLKEPFSLVIVTKGQTEIGELDGGRGGWWPVAGYAGVVGVAGVVVA